MKTEFILSKTFPFEAAHRLDHHDGKCARLHGHSFKLTIVVAGANTQEEEVESRPGHGNHSNFRPNPKGNMLLDYGDISEIVKPFVESHLDHHFLNKTLETEMPTSEYIASFCFDYFSREFRQRGVELREVRISETCTSEAIYRLI